MKTTLELQIHETNMILNTLKAEAAKLQRKASRLARTRRNVSAGAAQSAKEHMALILKVIKAQEAFMPGIVAHKCQAPYPIETKTGDVILNERCQCGHTAIDHNDSAVQFGHGSCGHNECACEKFTWLGHIMLEK